MVKAAVYVRISLDRSGKRAGVERQRTDCEALCAGRGWIVTDIYEDNSVSAYSGARRPAYERLVAAVGAGEVDVVVAWHTDRLWRNVVEQQTFLAIGRDAGLHLVATPHSEVNPADADDDFLSTVLAAAAQKESADKSRRMRRRQAEKAERGEFHGGRRSYGYRSVGGGRLEVVEGEAEVIRDATRRILAGESIHSVVVDLIRQGITTANGTTWRVDTMSALLISPRIAGLRAHRGATPVAATWPAIINLEDHERLVALSESRRRGPRAREPHKHLLTGFLRCGKCRARMQPGISKGVERYVCPPSGNGGCAGVTVTAAFVEDEVRDLVVDWLDSPEFAVALERARRLADRTDQDLTAAVEQLNRDRAALASLDDAFADGVLDQPRYKRQVTRLTARIADGEAKVASMATTRPALSYEGQGETIRKAWDAMTLEERRTVIGAVADHFVITRAQAPKNVWRRDRVRPTWRS